MRNASRTPAAFVLTLLLAAGAAAGVLPRPGSREDGSDDLVARARAFLAALASGDFQGAAKDFDATMARVSGPDKLKEFWTQAPAQLGEFKRLTGAVREETLGPYRIVLVTTEFGKATLDARVVFDKEGRIAGFQFVPSTPAVSYAPPDYADPAAFEETEVTVGTEPWTLPGTLARPKGPGPFPGLVLVHGSGPNDRDETVGPNKPFRDLAWGLASRGIAVLRYEKRTRVWGAKMTADPKLAAALTVKEETVDDAALAVALLRSVPGVDPARVFVLGHSLGGYLVPRIAAAVKPPAAGYVVMAGLARPLPETILRQMRYLYGLSGPLTDDSKQKLAELEAQVAAVDALTPADAGSDKRFFSAGAAYHLDLRGYAPAEAAKAIDRPLLVLQGGRDYQVTTDDFALWKAALAGRADVAFKLYPALNHLFFAGKGLPTPAEYTTAHGSVDRQVVEDVAGWILSGRRPS